MLVFTKNEEVWRQIINSSTTEKYFYVVQYLTALQDFTNSWIYW